MSQDALKHKKDAGLLPRPNYYLALSVLTIGNSFAASTFISAKVRNALTAVCPASRSPFPSRAVLAIFLSVSLKVLVRVLSSFYISFLTEI